MDAAGFGLGRTAMLTATKARWTAISRHSSNARLRIMWPSSWSAPVSSIWIENVRHGCGCEVRDHRQTGSPQGVWYGRHAEYNAAHRRPPDGRGPRGIRRVHTGGLVRTGTSLDGAWPRGCPSGDADLRQHPPDLDPCPRQLTSTHRALAGFKVIDSVVGGLGRSLPCSKSKDALHGIERRLDQVV